MTIAEYIGENLYYDKYGCQILSGGAGTGSEFRMIADIRGWGALSNMMSEGEATKFQDQLGQFIADAINEKLQRGEK